MAPSQAPKLLVPAVALLSILLPPFVPDPLLTLLPLLGAYLNLQWCYDEYFMLSPFLDFGHAPASKQPAPSADATTDAIIGHHYSRWFASYGPVPAAAGVPLTVSSTLAVMYRLYFVLNTSTTPHGPPSPALLGLYALALALAVLHVPYGHAAYGLLDTVKAGERGKAEPALRQWLAMHRRRCWVVDLPAFVAYLGATVWALQLRQ